MIAPRAVRIEGAVQVVILLFMGGMAGAASFVHIHEVTVSHGQPSWIGWANAVVIELMSIVAGLEIRRRRRAARHYGSVLAVLLTATGISLAAQVATAQPSVWGWIVAALPALGLLAVVKIVLSRTADHPNPSLDPTAATPGPPARSTAPGPDAHDDLPHGRSDTITYSMVDKTAGHRPRPPSTQAARPARPRTSDRVQSTPHPQTVSDRVAGEDRDGWSGPAGPTPRSGPPSGPDRDQSAPTGPPAVPVGAIVNAPDRLDEVIALGHTIAAELRNQDRALTRAALIDGIRNAGHTIGTDKATALLRRLKTTEPAATLLDR